MNTLASKIALASLDVGGKLSADRTNTEQRYDYLSADKILSVCGQALARQDVTVLPALADQDVKLFEYTDQYGKPRRRYDAQADFIFTITDGDTTIEQMWFGMGSDYTVPDKALYKAITSGHKYFLMKLLCVGAGNEDGDHEGEEPEPRKTQGKAPAKKEQPTTVTDKTIEYPPELAIVTNSEGAPYVTLETETLVHMLNSITKAAKKPDLTDDQASNYSMKADAIKQILALRNG